MNKKLSVLVLIITLALVLTACQTQQSAPTATTAPVAETAISSEPVLTLTGAKETKSFTMEDLMKLPATEGQAGIKSSTGKITPPTIFKGVLLTDLLQLVGGADETMGVEIEATDGYAMTFSSDQIKKGDFIAYDPATGDELKDAGKLQVLLAYAMDGKPLDTQLDGNLRLVVINDKPTQVVDGHWSVKFIKSITIKPLAAEWSIVLQGAITDEVDRGTFESCSTGQCHPSTYKDDKAQTWSGTPLYLLVGRVDDETKHGTGAFNVALADQGYTVDIIGKDGYTVTLDAAKIKDNKNIILAYQVNDNNLTDADFPLRLVGSDLTKKEFVGGVEKIVVHLNGTSTTIATATEAAAATESGEAALALTGLVDNEQSWTMDALKAMKMVKESVEHPKKGKMDVEGISLNALLDLAAPKTDAKTLIMTAVDGYSVQVDLSAVRACPTCLVAFDESGGLKTIMPGMESSLWAKDLVKLEIK